VARYPAYLPAMQQLGQHLNDRGESVARHEVLERARMLQPQSARPWPKWGVPASETVRTKTPGVA